MMTRGLALEMVVSMSDGLATLMLGQLRLAVASFKCVTMLSFSRLWVFKINYWATRRFLGVGSSTGRGRI